MLGPLQGVVLPYLVASQTAPALEAPEGQVQEVVGTQGLDRGRLALVEDE